jgi:integrase
MRAKISKRSVDALRPGERDSFLWDTELPGFGCKITPKGSRVYILQYGQGGRDHRVTIGRHGIDVTPEQARLEATRLRGVVAAGETPATRAKQAGAVTIAELGHRYLDEYAIPHKKPSGIAQDRRNLDNHVVPLIGKLLVKTVQRTDVARVMREVAAGKTAKDEKTKRQGRRIVRGGEIVANRVHALLSKMFVLAEDWGLRKEGTNPCRGAKRYAERKVQRFLSNDELARLGAALSAIEQGNGREPYSGTLGHPRRPSRTHASSTAALRLLLLTGCRVGEILGLRWQHFDPDRRLLLLPDSKTGAKSVFLSQPAIDLLLSIPHYPGSECVFAGERLDRPIVSLRKPWERICAAGNLENLRLHDLRHSFASVGAASGLSLPMIGALLGHSQPSTTARYAHLAASPIHQAADAIGAQIVAAMSGSVTVPTKVTGLVAEADKAAKALAGRQPERLSR